MNRYQAYNIFNYYTKMRMIKTIAIATATFALCAGAQAQGTLNFITDLELDGPFVVTDIGDVAGTRVGQDWSAQVLAGPQGGTLAAVGNVRAFGTNPGDGSALPSLNGVIQTADVISVSTVPGNTQGSYQLAVFQTSFGTYANAVANNAVHLSEVVNVTFGGGTPPNTATPPNVDGFTTFAVPEPTTALLGLLGLGGLVASRRRKNA